MYTAYKYLGINLEVQLHYPGIRINTNDLTVNCGHMDLVPV